MITTQISQSMINSLIETLNKNSLDYTDSIILKKRLIALLDAYVQSTQVRFKYHHLIKNQNSYILGYVESTRIKKRKIYARINLENSLKDNTFVNVLIQKKQHIYQDQGVQIYEQPYNIKYTALTLGCIWKSNEKYIDYLQLSLKKIKFKDNV